MKVTNFIWSGGSMGAGGGFGPVTGGFGEHYYNDLIPRLKKELYQFNHPKLKKYFNKPYTVYNVRKQIDELVFPNLLGKSLGASNIQNLSQGAYGLETHIRMIFSYIFENSNKLNFKETVVALDLTPPTRIELCEPNPTYSIEFMFTEAGTGSSEYFFKNYFHLEHRIMVYFQNLYFLRKFAESMGFKLFIFTWHNSFDDMLKYDKENSDLYRKQINIPWNTIDKVDFPNIEKLIEEIDIIELPMFHYSNFKSRNFHDDGHYTPEGHKMVSDKMYEIIKNSL